MAVLDAEVLRRDLKKPDFCVGLAEDLETRLLHVEEAGILGGGILSYRVGPESLVRDSDNFD